MSSFLVLCEGDTRNRWRDGQVCPDVRQGTMAPWARRLGREGKSGKEGKEEEDEKSRERTDGEKKWGENGRRENGEETRGENRRDGWRKQERRMEKRAESGNWSEKDDERLWR
ncbi:hypothetical protein TNCV_2696231 [Trichonephila clavipes]|nr:hypothetical protein TNCV_2696231 [Trichonephila clavipes]